MANFTELNGENGRVRAQNDGANENGVGGDVLDETRKDTAAVIAEDDWVYPYPTRLKIVEKPIDRVRELKVAVIGAGLAGINAGILLPVKVPGIKLTILEKNSDVGGTWLENIYPGVRCDIPAHCYQSTFAPNTQWSEEYAQGAEILAYWQKVAKDYNVHSLCRFGTKVLGCFWGEAESQWLLKLEDLKTHEQYEERFDFLITAIGHFNEFKLPKIPGMESFKGHLRHSSNWDPKFDPTGKRIATIGNGASGIQVTTELQKTAGHLDHYARSKTWIAGAFSKKLKAREDKPMTFSQEQLESFRDPPKYLAFRKELEDGLYRGFAGLLRDSDTTRTSEAAMRQQMSERLSATPELVDKIVPDFPPFCRRLTPGPGYLEVLGKENVEFIQTPIQRITEDGIITADGVHRPVDAIICSTGANVDFAPPFPIVAGEYDLSRDWRPDGKFGFPYSYLSIGTPGFPNLSFLLGPNPPGSTGTVPHGAENQVTYVANQLRKISSQGIATMTPSKAAADDFTEYCDAFFPRTNMSRKCSSWYNGGRPGARIHGVWPGSAQHWTRVMREQRWEDYEYTYVRKGNRLAEWLGNGWTDAERSESRDVTSYLRLPGDNDLRDIHERWWDM